ncbi:MAG: Fe(3+) ABC transporter substrate-binding protein [Bacteroidota bacterium]|nr:Fe(3+) ABC transporter substrate-binding protein [Bacteroidota bacterium]
MQKLLLAILIVISSCSSKKELQEVNLYSQRHYSVDEVQYKKFEELTGIKVNVVKANADELIERLKNEGKNSRADLFITVDAGKLYKARESGLLQKLSSDVINENVKQELQDPDGYWAPITYRARILVYSKERVQKSELSTYEDLINPKWKNRLLARSSSNAYNQALMSSLVANLGPEKAANWSEGVVSNFARDPKGSDRDQVRAIAAGQGDIAIVNSYYIGILLSSEKDQDVSAGNSVEVFFPNQGENERGSHINVSAIGLTKNAPNKSNAIKLIEYLTSVEAQKVYINNSYEYPVNAKVEPSEIVKKWGEFKVDMLNLNKLGEFREEAIKIFDSTGWK